MSLFSRGERICLKCGGCRLSPYYAGGGRISLAAAAQIVRLVQAKRRFHPSASGWRQSLSSLPRPSARPTPAGGPTARFADDVAYVRNRTTGELSAFVAVTVATEESDRSIPRHADAVGNLQAGTAVFRFDRDHWVTDGRAILNLSPNEAVEYYHADLEIVGEELAHRR